MFSVYLHNLTVPCYRYGAIDSQQKCSLCNFPLVTRSFYFFPCSHTFHSDCLVTKVHAKSSLFLLFSVVYYFSRQTFIQFFVLVNLLSDGNFCVKMLSLLVGIGPLSVAWVNKLLDVIILIILIYKDEISVDLPLASLLPSKLSIQLEKFP